MCVLFYFGSSKRFASRLPSFLQRDDVPAQHHGSVSAGEGTGTARVLETVTEIAGGVVLDLLTGGVRGEETLFKHGRLVLSTVCFLGCAM